MPRLDNTLPFSSTTEGWEDLIGVIKEIKAKQIKKIDSLTFIDFWLGILEDKIMNITKIPPTKSM